METKKKIYISLPISGRDPKKARMHADMVKSALSKMGFEPVNPFEIYAGENPSYNDHLADDIRALLDCDGICLCGDGVASFGVNVECAIAMLTYKMRKPDFLFFVEDGDGLTNIDVSKIYAEGGEA